MDASTHAAEQPLTPSSIDFPLITFSQTPEYAEKNTNLNSSFRKLLSNISQRGLEFEVMHPRLDFNLEPEAFFKAPDVSPTTSIPLVSAYGIARSKGISGWFRLTDIQNFIRGGEGIIFESAMYNLGYQSDNSQKYYKIDRKNKRVNPATALRGQRIIGESTVNLKPAFLSHSPERIKYILIDQPPSTREEGYSFLVNKFSQLFFYMPSYELRHPQTPAPIGASRDGLLIRDFIEPKQKGFYFTFENIELPDKRRAIYLEARRSQDKSEKPLVQYALTDNISRHRFLQFCQVLSAA